VIIRNLEAADIETLLALDTATNPHPWNRNQWQDSLTNHLCLGIESHDTLQGVAITMQLPDEAELLLIAIQPEMQGKGLGRDLLAKLSIQLREQGKQRLFLEVRASNLVAQRCYLASGFTEIGRRKQYYPSENGREDALLYALNLDRTTS